MATTQYVGARYVPVFADPIEWNNTRAYEPLTIVVHNGNSYTSAQYVPKGIDISNESFWKLTGNYNAQVEQYRNEVKTYDSRITANSDAIATEKSRATAAEKVNSDAIATEESRATAAEKVNSDAIKLLEEPDYMLVIGDSFCGTNTSIEYTKPTWWQYVEKATGTVGKVYAVGGTGYITATKTFIKQVQEAVADTSYNHDKVKYAIVEGGINDASNYSVSDVITVYNAIHAEFKNAKILIVFNKGRLLTANSNNRRCVFNDLSGNGIPVCSLACIEQTPTYIRPDNVHPVDGLGSAVIGSYIAHQLGCGNFYTNTQADTPELVFYDEDGNIIDTVEVSEAGTHIFEYENGYIDFQLQINLKNVGAQNFNIYCKGFVESTLTGMVTNPTDLMGKFASSPYFGSVGYYTRGFKIDTENNNTCGTFYRVKVTKTDANGIYIQDRFTVI